MGGFFWSGCRAIITGASSGLGAEFARQLAGRSEALLLVARRRAPMEALAAELTETHADLTIEIVEADLGTPEGVQGVAEVASSFQPNLLVNNAGLGDYGAVASAAAERLRAQMRVNMEALVMLTREVLPNLTRPGAILNVGSLAATLPMPECSVYAATKAFVDSFSEGLAIELAGEGVTVTQVCPGPTPTSFGSNARRADGEDTNRSGQDLLRIPPEQVVAEGLAALEKGKARCFPGTGVKVAGPLFELLPRPILRMLLRRRFDSTPSPST